MHIAAVSTLLFAALATAESHGHARRFHHRRALNETLTTAVTTAEEPMTTLTVQTTVLSTIYNCGKNITLTTCDGNHATDAKTVTQVVDLTVTVCPVAQASSISKSVLASATIPASVDANPTPIQSEQDNSPVTTDQVLSYTLGPEGSKTVVTTTIKNTKTASEYTTLTQTLENNSPEGTTVPEVPAVEQTTTLSSTTTSTRTVTVPAGADATPSAGTDTNVKTPTEGSEGNSPTEDDAETPSGGEAATPSKGSEAEGDCPAPVTVTVAATTVYVTVSPSAITPEASAPSSSAPQASVAPVGDDVDASTPIASAPVDDEEEGPQSTIYVIPTQRYSNNTMPAPTGGPTASSGFLTKTRGPTGTGSAIETAPTAEGLEGLFARWF